MPLSVERLDHSFNRVTDPNGRLVRPEPGSYDRKQNRIPGRRSRVTNAAAFREFEGNIAGVNSLINVLRYTYPNDNLTLKEFGDLTCTIAYLPYYLALRSTRPVSETLIPAPAIDAARIISGIFEVAGGMYESGKDLNQHYSVDEIYNFANSDNPSKRNYFLSKNGDKPDEACPAPEKPVKEILRTMLDKPSSRRIAIARTEWRSYLWQGELESAKQFALIYNSMIYDSQDLALAENLSPEDKSAMLVNLNTLYFAIQTTLGYTDKPEKEIEEGFLIRPIIPVKS